MLFSLSLKCRRCAVVGNGHRLRNSSMGETINTYDVVIRYGPGLCPVDLSPLPPAHGVDACHVRVSPPLPCQG